jgi:hypothetical protein
VFETDELQQLGERMAELKKVGQEVGPA